MAKRRKGKGTRKNAGRSSLQTEYTAIVQREWSFVRRVARRCGVPASDCDDVVVEVFLRLEKHIDVITPPHVLRAWLRTTTVNLSYEHVSGRGPRYERPTAAELLKLGGQAASLEDSYVKEEARKRLLAHVSALEPRRRTVFLAYVVDGIPIAEIAERLGIPEATAYNRLRLARRDLRAALHRERLIESRK